MTLVLLLLPPLLRRWLPCLSVCAYVCLPQGGRVTSLALTDTQLLLGSTAGVVQYFDLFSGQQQLITRHGSGVTCLRTYRQQGQPSEEQQQQQQLGLGSEEWMTIVGCTDGQVSQNIYISVGARCLLHQLH